MNCEEFQKRLLIDPMDVDPVFRAHAGVCADCAREAERALAFEARLSRALMETAGTGDDRTASHRRGARLLVGLAPLLAALIWWSAGSGIGPGAERRLAGLVITHVAAEPELLGNGAVPPAGLSAALLLLRTLGVEGALRLDGRTLLRHAGRCRIGRGDGAHLVIEGERGPVTLLVMPKRTLSARRQLHGGRFDTLLVPTSDAAVALVGESGEPLAAVADRLVLEYAGK